MGLLSTATDSPFIEIVSAWGGYIFSVNRPCDRDEWDTEGELDDEDVSEIRTHVFTDIDTMLAQVKRYLIEQQERRRKVSFGDTAVDEEIPAKKDKK